MITRHVPRGCTYAKGNGEAVSPVRLPLRAVHTVYYETNDYCLILGLGKMGTGLQVLGHQECILDTKGSLHCYAWEAY